MLMREPGILEFLALMEDTKLWASKGSGKDLNVEMACVLGRSMLSGIGANYMKAVPRRKAKRDFYRRYKEYFDFEGEKETVGHLRFGHAESVLPLISLLVEMGEGWDAGAAIPARSVQSAGLQRSDVCAHGGESGDRFVGREGRKGVRRRVECFSDYYVQILINEMPTEISTRPGVSRMWGREREHEG